MLRIESVTPTVLFKQTDAGLQQAVDVCIKNTAKAPTVGGELTFHFPGREPVVCSLAEIAPKTHAQRAFVPDVREPCQVEIELTAPRCKPNRTTVSWQPRKHWEIHLVPIAHHDYGYTDTIEDVLLLYKDLYHKVIDYCEATADYPPEAQFHYNCEEAWSLRHFVAHADPAAVDKLATYVAEGRVEIPALSGNQTSGMCGHEELVRLTYPSRALQRRLGGEICVGSITDVPGLSWALPTVLAGAGVRYFFAGLPHYFTYPHSRTSWNEAEVMREHGAPDAFWWEGPDGSKVLVYYQGGYGGFGSPESVDDVTNNLLPALDNLEAKGNPFSVFRAAAYGCGDNTPTSTIGCEIARQWNAEWAFPKLRMSTNTKFFRALEPQCENLRTHRGELPHTDYAVGAVSSAAETSLNRLTHDRLPAVERFAAVASVGDPGLLEPACGHFHDARLLELDEPEMALAHRIDQAYFDMVMFDEHTWGMWGPVGSIQDFSWHDKARHAYRAAALTTILGRRSLMSIAKRIAREDGDHIVVFNPLTAARSDVVRVDGLEADQMWLVNELQLERTPFDLIDLATGNTVPYQLVEIDSPQSPRPHAAARVGMGPLQPVLKYELLFKAEDVPAVGYKTYRLRRNQTPAACETTLAVTESSIENAFFRISVNAKTGAIESVYDKQLDRELADTAATYHVNQLLVRDARTTKIKTPTRAKVRVGMRGPIAASLQISSQAPGCPQVTQEIVLLDGIKRIDFNNRVLKDSTPLQELYVAFPFKADSPSFAFEGTNSVIRPFVDQLPGSNTNYYSVQHWAEVHDGKASITLTPIDSHLVEFGGIHPFHVSPAHRNVEPRDFKQGFVPADEVRDGHMFSFALASNFCTNFRPAQRGDLLLRYSVTAHEGDWTTGAPRDFGWARANELMPVVLNEHAPGERPTTDSFCQIDQANVALTSLKLADDADGLIVRLVETEGAAGDVTVHLPFLDIAEAVATDLVERNGTALAHDAHSVTVPVGAFGIATFRVRGKGGGSA